MGKCGTYLPRAHVGSLRPLEHKLAWTDTAPTAGIWQRAGSHLIAPAERILLEPAPSTAQSFLSVSKTTLSLPVPNGCPFAILVQKLTASRRQHAGACRADEGRLTRGPHEGDASDHKYSRILGGDAAGDKLLLGRGHLLCEGRSRGVDSGCSPCITVPVRFDLSAFNRTWFRRLRSLVRRCRGGWRRRARPERN